MKTRTYVFPLILALVLVMGGLLGLTAAGAFDGTQKEIVRTKRAYKRYKHKLIILNRKIPRLEASLATAKKSRAFARKKYVDLSKRMSRIADGTISLTPKQIIKTKIAYKKYKNKLLQLRRIIPKLQAQLKVARKSKAFARKKYFDLAKRLAYLRSQKPVEILDPGAGATPGDTDPVTPDPGDAIIPGGNTGSSSAWETGVGMPEAYNSLPALEGKLGQKLDIFLWYQSLAEDFDVGLADWLWQRGTKIQLAWEPHNPSKSPSNQPEYRLTAITRGDYDPQIRRWAQQIKDFGHPVYFRPMCEMNSDYVAWGAYTNGNKPEEYIPAWRHVRNIFREVGADNALFIWSPNRAGSERSAEEIFDLFYPGDAYVDYVGIDGYNWGLMYDTPSWTSRWQSFKEVFGPMYNVAARRTNKPIFISETASTEVGGSKATWINNAFAEIRASYPRIKAVVWFNYNKETDWRIDNNDANLEAFRTSAFN